MDYSDFLETEYTDDSLDEETISEMDDNEDDRDGQWYEYSYGSLIDRIEDMALEYEKGLYAGTYDEDVEEV